MIEAVFFAVPGNSKLQLWIVLFRSLADSAPVHGFFSGRLRFEFSPATSRFGARLQVSEHRWRKKNEIVQEGDENRRLCSQRPQDQLKHEGCQKYEGQPFHL